MARWGIILIGLILAALAAAGSWNQWSTARQSLLEAASWRNETRLAEEQLQTLLSQREALEFVVPADDRLALSQQIQSVQQKNGIPFPIENYKIEPLKTIPGLAMGQTQRISIETSLQKLTAFVKDLESSGPFWIRVQQLSIQPGTKVQQGEPEMLKVEMILEFLTNHEPSGS